MSLVLLLTGAALAAGDVRFDDASLEFDGTVLDHRFVDPDGDGTTSLCVALLRPDGTRELRLHPLEERRLAPEPSHAIPVLEDVLAYGFADVREEPGEELLFLTRTGAFSYSLERNGYRGNITRLATLDLIYSVPDRRKLPFWAYTVPGGAGDRDLVLLPGRGGLVALGPREEGDEGEDPYVARARFGAEGLERDEGSSMPDAGVSGRGGLQLNFELARGEGPFLAEGPEGSLLSGGESYEAPALVDVNGDGLRDLLLLDDDRLRVHLCGPRGLPSAPTRVELVPEELREQPTLTLVELNGDGYLDVLASSAGERGSFTNDEQRVFVHLGGPEHLLSERPDQVLRFEAATLRAFAGDLNGDGRTDLLLRKFVMPSAVEAVSGLEFELSHLAFFGTGGRVPFERKPALNHSESYDVDTIGEVVKRRRLERDCDGDGLLDLVEVDVRGRIAIRRVVRDSGFFSGETWELEDSAWKRLDARGSILALEVHDLDGDGLADLVSPGASSITVFLSDRGR